MSNGQRLFLIAGIVIAGIVGLVLALVLSVTSITAGEYDCGSLLSQKNYDLEDTEFADLLDREPPAPRRGALAFERECDDARGDRLTIVLILGIGGLIAVIGAVWQPQQQASGGDGQGKPPDPDEMMS